MPVAVITGANTVGTCSALTLRGGLSTGIDIRYSWSSPIKSSFAQNDQIIFSPADIADYDDTSLDVTLTVTDAFGVTDEITHFIALEKSPIPVASVQGSAEMAVVESDHISVNLIVNVPACVNVTSLTYEWEISDSTCDSEFTSTLKSLRYDTSHFSFQF